MSPTEKTTALCEAMYAKMHSPIHWVGPAVTDAFNS